MCKLITITKTKGENQKAETLVRLQFKGLRTQPDGCAGLNISFDNKVKVYREIKDYDKVFEDVIKELPDRRLVFIHTRIGNSGLKNLDNVHFFKPNDWYFAHNGFAEKYGSHGFHSKWNRQISLDDVIAVDDRMVTLTDDVPGLGGAMNRMINCQGCATAKRGFCRTHAHLIEQIRELEQAKEASVKPKKASKSADKDRYCDSYQFVDNLPKKMNPDTIIEHMAESKFNGMGLLINKNGKDMYMLVAKTCYAVTDHESYAGFFSYDPDLKASIETSDDLCGIKVEGKKITIAVEEKRVEIVKGVYNLDPERIKSHD